MSQKNQKQTPLASLLDYSGVAHKYARDVVADKIIACKWIKLACQKHLDDLVDAKSKGFAYKFDSDAANKKCHFIEQFPHTKGKWAAKQEKFKLEPWQCFLVCSIFGWIRKKDLTRRYRKALVFVSRKNGKSDIAARIGLAMFAADNEHGAEVYSGATSEKQAYEVFRPARLMSLANKDFKEYFGVDVHKSVINIFRNGSRFEPIIGKPGDGASPSCAIVDEYHEHKTDELFDTMETGMGAREQPLMLVITTAGDNISGPCYALQKQAERVLEGHEENDELFSLIYTIDVDDDWQSIDALKKANPNFGVSVNEDFLNSRLKEAVSNARKQGVFKTKHLNIWVGARNAYYNVENWNSCAVPDISLEDYEGERAIIGLDLAHKIDIAALEIIIPVGNKQYVRFGKYYLPYDTVMKKENEHYQGWMKENWLTVTDGQITDFDEIKNDILDLSTRFQLEYVAYDPAQATMLVNELQKDGVNCVEVRPTVLNFSEPMKELDARMRTGNVIHNGDPVMSWMISNVVAKEDAKENVYPRKEVPENKIDGVVAHLMALNLLIGVEEIGMPDDYELMVI